MLDACRIRVMAETDLPMVLVWRNHSDVRRFMLTQQEISPEEHRKWFTASSLDPSRRLLIIEEVNQPIGYVQFSEVSDGGIAEWGFYSRPNSPRGTGRKLGVVALNHAFGPLRLHKVCGKVIGTNHVSIAFHQRLGFLQEGLLRDQKRTETGYLSLYCFGLLSTDWKPEKVIRE